MFQWLLAIICVGYIIYFFTQNSEKLALFKNISPVYVLVLAVVSTLGQLLTCYRFGLVLRKASGACIKYWQWFKLYILGFFLNQIIPQAGNVYRSILLKREYSVTYTKYIASFFSFSWMQTCVNLFFALIVVILTNPEFKVGSCPAIYFLLIILTAGLCIPIVLSFLLPRKSPRKNSVLWTRDKISEVLHISVDNLKDGVYITKFLISGLIVYMNALLTYYIAFRAFGLEIEFAPLALFLVILTLSTRVVITPGNIGLRELAFGVLSEYMNIGMAEGIAVSTLIRLVGMVLIFSLGLLFGGRDALRSYLKK